MDKCSSKKRNQYHKCSTPLRKWRCKRLVDGAEAYVTICDEEKERIEKLGWFKFYSKEG